MSVTLFCLPFAGGSRYSLFFLGRALPPGISCHYIEYPGRGTRIKERFVQSQAEMIDDIYRQIAPLLTKPYAIYGHSMGATLTYLLTRRIQQEGKPAPLHLFISGTDAPSVPLRKTPKYLLPKPEFIEAVKELGGLPDEVLAHEEMLEYFEPILRADFRIIETYNYQQQPPLKTAITVMVGDEEDMEEPDILAWQNETSIPMRLIKFPGNHFFIYKHEKEIARIIASTLLPPTFGVK